MKKVVLTVCFTVFVNALLYIIQWFVNSSNWVLLRNLGVLVLIVGVTALAIVAAIFALQQFGKMDKDAEKKEEDRHQELLSAIRNNREQGNKNINHD